MLNRLKKLKALIIKKVNQEKLIFDIQMDLIFKNIVYYILKIVSVCI